MKLAEALIERADLQKITAQTANRMKQNAITQEGEPSAEEISELLSQYEGIMEDLENTIVRINRTNCATPFEDITLADAITQRDCLKSIIKTYRELYDAASIRNDRYSRTEIKFVRCVDMAELQKKIDGLSKAYRELDTKIQALNWTTELV